MNTELHRPTCEGCHVLMGISEARVMIHKKVFHEECYKKHMAEVHRQQDIKQEQTLQVSARIH